MSKLGGFILEMLRMCILFVICSIVLGGLERWIYQVIFGYPQYNWSMMIGNVGLFFILYRNFFQFKGWYKSEKNKKLSRTLTRSLTAISLALVIVPVVM